MTDLNARAFPQMNRAYDSTFRANQLTLGLVMPIEAHANAAVPALTRHLERAQLADELGFAALWLRDVPFNVPSFGDAGQTFDPFVYLGLLAGATTSVSLGVASVILPLRHPAHVAKSAASADVLSGGRLLLGVASGDRPEEYPAMGVDFHTRDARFRDSFAYIRGMADPYPQLETTQGTLTGGADMLPKPCAGHLPLLVTGSARQDPDWVARNSDGWITYPRDPRAQASVVSDYRTRIAAAGGQNKPVMQSLYIDLQSDPGAEPRPIHLGFSSGLHFLRQYLTDLRGLGINHVALNLRFNRADVEETMHRIAADLLPDFSL